MSNLSTGKIVVPQTPCKIGLIGPKEVGKTTLSNYLNGYLKSLGASSDLVHETARGSPFLLNENSGIETAYWLLGSQISAETLVQARRQFVICDRTIMDLLPFTICGISRKTGKSREAIRKSKAIIGLEKMIRDYVKIYPYQHIFYVPIKKELWHLYSYPENIKFQHEVDLEFRKFLKRLNIKFHELNEISPEGRVKEIMQYILEKYKFRLHRNNLLTPMLG